MNFENKVLRNQLKNCGAKNFKVRSQNSSNHPARFSSVPARELIQASVYF
ncbi:hypothetical protein D1BOALGB6SA_3167 [Olavius sp. associated proteobacterium Delta 1]|nr:hypothetical protein D1BOALGB6SA_3167 [Olavius sp. associated proteobacterium Delta 1]